MNNIKTAIDRRLENAVLPEHIYETALRKTKKRVSCRPAYLLAAAVALSLIGCAAAAGGLLAGETGGSQRLKALFGTENHAFTAVGNVCTGNGVSVSLDGVYGNDKLFFMAFTAVREDGKPFAAQDSVVSFENYHLFALQDGDTLIQNISTMAPRLYPSSDLREIHYILYASGSGFKAAAGETLRIQLDNIRSSDGKSNECLVDGSWTFDVPYDSMEQPMLAKAGQRIPCKGDTLVIDELAFTSSSWHIRMTAESGRFSGRDAGYDYHQISLKDVSGKTYSIDWARDYIRQPDAQNSYAHPIFFGLLPQGVSIKDMTHIILFGTEIPLVWP